jgi:hypothetical protein
MPTVRLLTALRDHLVTAGIVRDPSAAGPLPPFWREPKLGTPAPGEGNNPTEVGTDIVVGAYLVGGIAPQAYGSWSRWQIVEIRFRTSKGYMAEDVELAISGQLIDRRDFMLGGSSGLYVVECQQNLPLQRLSSDAQGFEHLTQYVFQTYRPGYTGIH